MKLYTVYKHTAPNGKVYIGITARTVKERWHNGSGYAHSIHFDNAIKKYGWENIKHEILFENLTQEEAEQKEVELIKKYKATDRRYGYNSDSGGNVNKHHSEETKKKISQAHIGMKYDENFRKKMSELKKGNKNNLGRKKTEEERRKISEANKGRWAGEKNYFHTHIFKGAAHPNARPVEKYDLQGNFIERKECAMDFARELKITNATHIADVCRGKRKTAHGFIWKYARKEKTIK